jgi:hypothetical protein
MRENQRAAGAAVTELEEDLPPWEEPPRDLGPCCVCGKAHDGTVRNMLTLPFEGPRKTSGWGCVVCGLKPIGATAMVCDACVAKHHPKDLEAQLKWVVAGRYASEGKRVLLRDLPRRPHEHDPDLHAEDEL